MERFSSRPPSQGGHPNRVAPERNREDFAEMVDTTAKRPGVFGRLLVLSLIIVSIAVTAFVGYAIVNGVGSQSHIDGDKYQAVFLRDGQIYFGKLTNVDKQYAQLVDIYYLQVQNRDQIPQASDTDQDSQIQLVKLGREIHGPVDAMYINTDQILFWENLTAEGQVSDAIKRHKEQGDTTSTTPAPTSTTPAETEIETETP